MNQSDIVRQRRKVNLWLLLLFFVLGTALVATLADDIQRLYRAMRPLVAERIELVRDKDSIVLQKQTSGWQVTEPYQQKASTVVAEALLARLQRSCRALNTAPARTPDFYASILIDGITYRIGELNQASDEIYVQKDKAWLLCDKLIASMALAPAINFVDKKLYHGELTAIVGEFGRLTDLNGVDLSVLEVAEGNADALPKTGVSTLKFMGDSPSVYQAFYSEDGKHIVLFSREKSLIYVLNAQAKLTAIMGQ